MGFEESAVKYGDTEMSDWSKHSVSMCVIFYEIRIASSCSSHVSNREI